MTHKNKKFDVDECCNLAMLHLVNEYKYGDLVIDLVVSRYTTTNKCGVIRRGENLFILFKPFSLTTKCRTPQVNVTRFPRLDLPPNRPSHNENNNNTVFDCPTRSAASRL